jgi:predicted ATPase
MHLTELKIANFLAYEQAELPLGPHGLVLVIGPNNAGKSALLAALDVVAGTAQGGNWRRAGSTEFARVTATFTIDDDGEREFILGPGAHPGWMQELRAVRFEWEDPMAAEMLLSRVAVASEHGATGTILNAEFSAGSSSVTAVDRGMVFQQSPREANWELQSRRSGSPPSDPMMDAPSVLPGLPGRLQAWREWYFHFAPVRTGPGERSPLRDVVAKLDPTGANLAQALLYHQSRSSDQWRNSTEILNAIIPDAGQVQARAGGDEIEIMLQDPSTGAALNLKRLGTGVEQVLMLAYVGATQPVWSVVVMEEPESGLHPGAQRLLLEYLLEWARTRLIVVSTHSTVFLDHKDPERTQTYLVRRVDGVASLSNAVDRGVEALRLVGVHLSDVASAERVLLVEGDRDVEVMNAWFGTKLIRHGIAVVPMGGGDKAWHTETVIRVLQEADTLDRRVVFLRDRDELSDESASKLGASGNIHLLARRELENYLLEPDAIAQVLDGATLAGIVDALGPAADATRDTVLLKTVVARLKRIRTPDRKQVEELRKAGAGLDELVQMILDASTPVELEHHVREVWSEASAALDGAWEQRKLELAPGEEVLDAVWKAHGRRYDKKRDGPRIAMAMQQPPTELDELINSLAET